MAPPHPLLPEKLPVEIDKFLQTARDDLDAAFSRSSATGGVATLVYGDSVLLTHGYGSTRAGANGSRVTSSTVFRIGSITKLFTTLILLQMQEDGLLYAEQPVRHLAPELKPKWPPGTRPTPRSLTFRDLGSHMAGLGRYDPCNGIYGVSCNISLKTALSRISEWTLLFEPGSRVSYSNAGFALLGRILERVGTPTFPRNESWELRMGRVSRALGFNDTTVAPPVDTERLAMGYEKDGSASPLQDLGFGNPSGALYSTARDFAVFLSFLLRDGAARGHGGSQPLDSATVRAWLSTRALSNPTNPTNSAGISAGALGAASHPSVLFTEWGMPWQTARVDLRQPNHSFSKYFVHSKDGAVPGYNAQMAVQPDVKLGIFVAMSTGESVM